MTAWTGWAALGVYLAGGVVGVGLRSWLHRRRTGDSGLRYTSSVLQGLPWWSQVVSGTGLALGALAPVLAALGLVRPAGGLDTRPLFAAGFVVAVAGFAGVFAAQQAMGRSWRIGVDAGEHTALVTSGVFAWTRNPVYTALLIAVAGIVGMVPTWLQLAASACVFAGVELQVRTVEEPHLTKLHGAAYVQYTAAVGRFVPGVGRGSRPARAGEEPGTQ
uniref:Isoprenylcysteine carboxylmethyltransferase family protein n=1 Tax=Streptomyces sp. NBC_00003 TaxID=2903608 RepID=A0AAU2VGB3_9ACTN